MTFFTNIRGMISQLTDILGNGLSTLLMTVAFIAFLISVINFIAKRRSGNADGLKQAGQMLWWSVFGLFVMVSVWGLVNFLSTNLLGDKADIREIARPQTKF